MTNPKSQMELCAPSLMDLELNFLKINRGDDINKIEIMSWGRDGQEISEDSIRKVFPKPEYRVTPRLYRANEILPSGAARAGRLFVLYGKCKCNFSGDDEISIVLNAGQYVNFPGGSYHIEPLGNQDAKIAFVWNVAKLFKEAFPNHPGLI